MLCKEWAIHTDYGKGQMVDSTPKMKQFLSAYNNHKQGLNIF